MNTTKNHVRSLLTVLIIGVLVGFQLGRSVVINPPAVSQTAEVSGQATTGPQPDFQLGTVADPSSADSGGSHTVSDPKPGSSVQSDLSEDGKYNSKDEVALYIKIYGHLPRNYVTKKTARNAGWSGGSLENYFAGCSIGGDVFRNREGLLPRASGRTYYECDIDSAGKSSRGSKRIVYSNDGLIYYTEDHYNSFTLLYGKAG